MEQQGNEKLNELFMAIGGVAEAANLFFNQLKQNNFNEKQALYLTKGFIQSMITGGKE